jgi:hypothetical protein
LSEKPARTIECSIEEVVGSVIEFSTVIYGESVTDYKLEYHQVDLLTLFAAGIEVGTEKQGYANFYIDFFVDEAGNEIGRYRAKEYKPFSYKPNWKPMTPGELDALSDWPGQPDKGSS